MSALPVPEPGVDGPDATQATQPRSNPAPSIGEPARGPAPRSNPAPQPPLRIVARRTSAARAPFVLLVSGLLAAGLVGVLVVNTRLAQGSFAVHQLQLEQSKYADQVQALGQVVADEQAPQALGARAIALGMVAAPNPVFKRDGAVLGAATAARKPPPPPAPSPTWSPSPSASTSASPTASSTASPSASPSGSVSPSASGSVKASASASASATASAKQSPGPSGSPKPTASSNPSPKPTPKPSAGPTAKPTAKPTGPAAGAHT
jgi:hypothetical protein